MYVLYLNNSKAVDDVYRYYIVLLEHSVMCTCIFIEAHYSGIVLAEHLMVMTSILLYY